MTSHFSHLLTVNAGRTLTMNAFSVPVSFTRLLSKSEPKNIVHLAQVIPPTTAGKPGKGPVIACLYSEAEFRIELGRNVID